MSYFKDMVVLFFIFMFLSGCTEPSTEKTLPNNHDTSTEWPFVDPWCENPVDSVFYTEVSQSMGLVDTTDDLQARKEANPIALADLDGDGLDDIILGQRRVGIWIQLNRGDSFETYLLSEVANVVGLAVADIDGDGDLDLWAGGYFDQMKMFANDGTGYFVDVSESSGVGLIAVSPQKMDGVFGDIDGDGDLDVYIAGGRGMFSNDGDGTFTVASSLLASSSSVVQLCVLHIHEHFSDIVPSAS